MYRPKTTLEQWRILQAVVDHGGYAQAAQALNKSQSSLNHAVSKLQAQLGVQLLHVVGRKAQLSEAGEVMLRRSRDLTQHVESLEQLAINLRQDWEPEITICVDLAYPREALLPVLKQFQTQSRGSRLKIIDTVLTGSAEAVSHKKADLVILMHVPKGHLGEPLQTVDFVLVCHALHELANATAPLDPNALAQHLQIVIKDTSQSPHEASGWLKSENRWTVSQFDTAVSLLMEQIGFCWLPKHVAAKYIHNGSLKKLKVKGSEFLRTTAFLVCPSPDEIGPGTQMLANLILQNRKVEAPSF